LIFNFGDYKMKTSNQQKFNISKDQLLQFSLETIKKDHYLFQISDLTDNQTFWFSITRKKLEEMVNFIDQYLMDN
jgi:hypothetical protein